MDFAKKANQMALLTLLPPNPPKLLKSFLSELNVLNCRPKSSYISLLAIGIFILFVLGSVFLLLKLRITNIEPSEKEKKKRDTFFGFSTGCFVVAGILFIFYIVLQVKRGKCSIKTMRKMFAATEVFRNNQKKISSDMSDTAQQELLDTIRREAM